MKESLFQIRQCINPECQFRFPAVSDQPGAAQCPQCGSHTTVVEETIAQRQPETHNPAPLGPPVEALLDNIRSIFNVGSMFRTADGACLRKVHLCGLSPTPCHPKIAKTGLGAEYNVRWSYHLNGLAAARELKEQGFRLWALEGGSSATSLFETEISLPNAPILLVVGNEVSGVDPAILRLCEKSLWIPMGGIKRSLNVAVAFGIAAYYLRYGTPGSKNAPAAGSNPPFEEML